MGSGSDQRKSRRRAVVLRIKLRYAGVDEFIAKFATNVSEAGMFVRSKNPKDPGTIVAFELRLADGSAVIRGRGEVRWVRPYDPDNPRQPHGMGIAFTRLDSDSQELIGRIVTLKREQGIADREGKIPHRLPTAQPEPEPEPEPAPEPVARQASRPLEPERRRKPRTTVGELLAQVGDRENTEPETGDLDDLLRAEVSMDAALARARQLTSSDVSDELLDELSGPLPAIEPDPEWVSRPRSRRRAVNAGATIEAPVPGNGVTIPAPISVPDEPAEPEQPEPEEFGEQATRIDKQPSALDELDGTVGPLLEGDDDIEAALATLLPEADDLMPHRPASELDLSHLEIGDEVGFHRINTDEALEQLEREAAEDGDAEQAQAAIDRAVDAAATADQRIDDLIEFDFGDDDPTPLGPEDALDLDNLPPLEEAGPGDPTFISDMPSAALASDLVADTDNQLGGGRMLDELLEPQEPLASDRVHGVEDFIDAAPSEKVPLGVDIDETLAVLESGAHELPAPPAGPPPPPPPGHRRAQSSLPPPPPPPRPRTASAPPPPPEDGFDLDIDLDGFPAPPPAAERPYDDVADLDDSDDLGKKKKGFFKRIFRKD